MISANGTACDTASTVTSLTLDGQPVALTGTPPCLDFMTQLSSQWGLNIITGSARNQVGATTNLVQAYLRSPSFSTQPTKRAAPPRVAAGAESVPYGLSLILKQKLIDGGNHAGPDNLVTLLERIVDGTGLNALIPSPLVVTPDTNHDGQVDSHTCDCIYPIPDITVHSTGYRVGRGTLSTGRWSVDYIHVSSNGLEIGLTLVDVSLPLSVSGYFDPSCTVACVTRNLTSATVNGTVGASAFHMTATVDASAGNNGMPQVDICPNCISVNAVNPYLDIDFGALEFLDPVLGLSNITTNILQHFQADLEQIIETQLANQLPVFFADFLKTLAPSGVVTLPSPMNTALNLGSSFDLIDLTGNYPDGSISVGLSVSVSPANPVIMSPYGSIRRGGDPPVFGPEDYAAGVGLKDDLLNQFLWAAWSGGALELDQLSATGCAVPDGFRVSMSAKLPPVVMPSSSGNQIDIGIGGLYLVATPNFQKTTSQSVPAPSAIELYASAIIGATISYDTPTEKLVLTPEDNPEIDVQIVHANEGTDLQAVATQYSSMLQCALPKLLTQLVGAMPVFSLPIGGLGAEGIPADTRWVLGDDASLARPDPYFTITGSVAVK